MRDPQNIKTYTVEVRAVVLFRVEVDAHSESDALEFLDESDVANGTILEVYEIEEKEIV